MSAKEATAIWTPDGIVGLDRQTERVTLTPGITEWLRQFSDVASHFRWGLHCAKCKADIIGKNSDNDKVFSATCGCTEWVGANRDYVPHRVAGFYDH